MPTHRDNSMVKPMGGAMDGRYTGGDGGLPVAPPLPANGKAERKIISTNHGLGEPGDIAAG